MSCSGCKRKADIIDRHSPIEGIPETLEDGPHIRRYTVIRVSTFDIFGKREIKNLIRGVIEPPYIENKNQ